VAKVGVIYDFHDDGLKPFTLILHFAPGELDPGQPILYIPLSAPFERMMPDELEETGFGVSVLLEDLTASSLHPHSFGIDLRSLGRRHSNLHLQLHDIERFIVRLGDIEEVLQSDLRKHYSWENY
jgi:hypothetical protein